jgi:hypothetical protein
MWRSHFVVLVDRPAAQVLAQLSDGYQLFQERRTKLYFLTAYSQPLGRRPDFSGIFSRETLHRIDVSFLKRFQLEYGGTYRILDHQLNFDLVQRAVSLSQQLAMRVLVTEITDDDYAIAVMANTGTIDYVRFRISAPQSAEAVYRASIGFTVDTEPVDAIYGLAETALADVFGVRGVDLQIFAEDPSLGAEADRDRFGMFKRLGYAPPKLTRFDRMLVPLRYAGSVLALPFILSGILAYAILASGHAKASAHVTVMRLFVIGLVVLAVPLVLLIWLIRAITGL